MVLLLLQQCNVAFVGFFFFFLKCCCTGEDFFPPTVLFTLGRYWHRQVSSQLSFHHALYMCSSQTDERKMVGERDESVGEKKKERGRK